MHCSNTMLNGTETEEMNCLIILIFLDDSLQRKRLNIQASKKHNKGKHYC
ncbi:hypothetical protein HanIR_Chr15g0777311 [Helianthus annuus]|nr:hypothetical protein HanIR_Chr15g0777311 [Helianthus annuus]